MKVGYVGGERIGAAVMGRLAGAHEVIALTGSDAGSSAWTGNRLAVRDCDAIIISLTLHDEVRDALLGSGGIAKELGKGKVIIDQTPADPDQARILSKELLSQGVVVLDAPIHCENVDAMPEGAAIMCGGPSDAFDAMRPLLESICPKVIYCGESGNGQAARLVVGAVAACNRLITYECASVGVKNGLAIEHMATVLNKSSGYNSASARVLPVLAAGGRTTDTSLEIVADELKLASRMAMRCGAPLLVANVAASMYEGAAKALGEKATLDDMSRIFEVSAGVDFEDRGSAQARNKG